MCVPRAKYSFEYNVDGHLAGSKVCDGLASDKSLRRRRKATPEVDVSHLRGTDRRPATCQWWGRCLGQKRSSELFDQGAGLLLNSYRARVAVTTIMRRVVPARDDISIVIET